MALNKTFLAACAAMTVFAVYAKAQQNTDAESWLTPQEKIRPSSSPERKVPYIIVAEDVREDAVRALESAPIIALNEVRAKYYGGEALGDMELNLRLSGDHEAEPFLVRGVNPNAGGRCTATLIDNTLHVGCFSLGNWSYEKRPYVVLLGRMPDDVFVYAMTAL